MVISSVFWIKNSVNPRFSANIQALADLNWQKFQGKSGTIFFKTIVFVHVENLSIPKYQQSPNFPPSVALNFCVWTSVLVAFCNFAKWKIILRSGSIRSEKSAVLRKRTIEVTAGPIWWNFRWCINEENLSHNVSMVVSWKFFYDSKFCIWMKFSVVLPLFCGNRATFFVR